MNIRLVAIGAAAPCFYMHRRGHYATQLELLARRARARRLGLKKEPGLAGAIVECTVKLGENARHPSLQTHPLRGHRGVFEAYVDMKNRITFHYGDGEMVMRKQVGSRGQKFSQKFPSKFAVAGNRAVAHNPKSGLFVGGLNVVEEWSLGLLATMVPPSCQIGSGSANEPLVSAGSH